ncbi:unnamed protein product [Sphagnum jensenii]|uniref:Peptidase S74 domain-containing protein n=1 Tax=Sphagnum jensenii TaxID=128206 RepID=A0ABP0V5Y8_9BRYO
MPKASGSMLTDALMGGGATGGYGLASGFGVGQSFDDRLKNSVNNGITGLAIGAPLSAVGGGGTSGRVPQQQEAVASALTAPIGGTSGTYVRNYNWTSDATNGILVRSDRMDGQDNDFATALSNCVTKDGQQTTTSLIPFSQGISIAQGLVNAPGIAVIGDTATGLYQPAVQQLAITTEGVNTAQFSSTNFTSGTHYTYAGGTPFLAAGTLNNYFQVSIQNKSSGTTASTDYIVTADTGTDTTNYIDFGINSSGYTGSAPFNAALDGYLYAQSANLGIGTVAAKSLFLATNNTTAITINSSQNVSMVGTLSVTGGVTVGGQNATAPLIDKIVVQKFTASGTYTPTTGMVFCIAEVQGGGGGGATAGGAPSTSGGGGAGGYAKVLLTAAQIGVSQTVTIGAGGGTSTGGGTTSLGSLVSCTGGATSTASSGGGNGGAGGVPTVNTGSTILITNGGAGSPATTGTNATIIGNGGNCPLGFGATQGNATASGYGAGGVGGINSGSGGSGTSDLAATWQQVEESTLVGFTLQNGVWAAPPVAPLTPKEQIDILEMTVTARRMRESVLGIDNGWLLNVNNQIAALRGQITE